MRKLLLDTNPCIHLINGTHRNTRKRLETALSQGIEILLSSVVIFELWYGVAKSHPNRREENAQALRAFLAGPFVELAFTAEDALAAGEIRASLEKAGTPIGAYDLLLAGQALCGDFTLITANVSEFSRVKGLRWKNWEV
jgi:tRNA(fMet)-specific endonuclease VapC